jgi:DNA-binding MarR family transcriptional regulator
MKKTNKAKRKETTGERILAILSQVAEVRVVDLIDELGVSRVLVQRKLKQLVAVGKIKRKGMPPLVYYALVKKKADQARLSKDTQLKLTKKQQEFLEKNYFYISPDGAQWREAEGLKKQLGVKVVIGYAVLGSMKGFEVIREV